MKRSTVYLEDDLHRALKLKSAEADRSMSDFVNEAVRTALAEELEDLRDIAARRKEKTVTFSALLQGLKKRGQL